MTQWKLNRIMTHLLWQLVYCKKSGCVFEFQHKLTSSQLCEKFSNSNWFILRETKVYVLWCLSLQRGVGIFSTGTKRRCSLGNIIGCLIEPFYLWYQPHLSGFTEQQLRKQVQPPRGNNRGRRDSLHSAGMKKYPTRLCLLYYSVM